MNYNEQNGFDGEKKTPWYLQADEPAPKDYNPYEDTPSVFEEIYEENKQNLGGVKQHEWESPMMYEERRARESIMLRASASQKLKQTVTGISVILLIALLMMTSLITSVSGFSQMIPEKYYNLFTDVLMVLQYVAVFPIVFYIATVGQRDKIRTYFKKPAVSKFYTFRFIMIMLGITYAVAILSDIIFGYLGEHIHINDLSTPLPSGVAEHILYFLAVVVCAPIFEELLFRGILLKRLSGFGEWFAVIVTAILFGMYHQNHAQLFFTAAFGVLAGFLAIRSKSIIPTIIAHACLNGYSYLNTLFLTFTDNYEEYMASTEVALKGPTPIIAIIGILNLLIYVFIIVGITMLITEIASNKAQFSLKKGDSGLGAGEKVLGLLSSPVMILLLLILISNIIIVSFVDIEPLLQELTELATY